MPARSKISDSDVLRMFRLSLSDHTPREISDEVGIEPARVSDVLAGRLCAGVEPQHPDRLACMNMPRRTRRKRVESSKLNLAVFLYEKHGAGLREAARIEGVDPATLGREIARRGLPKRSGPKPPKVVLSSAGAFHLDAALAAYRAGGSLSTCAKKNYMRPDCLLWQLWLHGIPIRDEGQITSSPRKAKS